MSAGITPHRVVRKFLVQRAFDGKLIEQIAEGGVAITPPLLIIAPDTTAAHGFRPAGLFLSETQAREHQPLRTRVCRLSGSRLKWRP